MEHVAIDLSSSLSQVRVRAADGEILLEKAWRTRDLERFLARRPASRVVLESSSEAFAVADIARGCGHQVVVVPALLVRALDVGARGVKNDRNDARATSTASCQLAELPSVHIPAMRSGDLKATCTSREALVGCRTKLVNTARSWMRTHLLTTSRGGVPAFPARARKLLNAQVGAVPEHVERLLEPTESLTTQINAFDKDLAAHAKQDPVCRRLMTVPGVGPVTAIRFLSAVDELARCEDAHRLQSYFGLTLGENITGFKGHRTRLTKAGQAQVRWALVQAAWSAMRCRANDPMVVWASVDVHAI